MNQLSLPADGLAFDGSDYRPEKDQARLTGQILRIRDLMADGRSRTLSEISAETGDPEASVSAQLRNLRKARFGGHRIVKARRGLESAGLYEYRLVPAGDLL